MSGGYHRVGKYELRERIQENPDLLVDLFFALLEELHKEVVEWIDGYGNHSHFKVVREASNDDI